MISNWKHKFVIDLSDQLYIGKYKSNRTMKLTSRYYLQVTLLNVLTLIRITSSFGQSCFPVNFEFEYSEMDECQVEFTQTIPSNVDSWFWQFGDGSVSEEQFAVHSYTQAGCFTVTLTVEVNGDENSISKQVCIYSCNGDDYGENGDFPVIIDGPSELGINIDYQYAVNVYGADPPYTYSWDFGSEGEAYWSGPHTVSYSAPGNEQIGVTVTDANGYTGSDVLDIEISEIAQYVDIAFGTARVNFPTAIIGEFDLLAFTEPLTFTFSYGDGSDPETGIVSFKYHTYTQEGDYTVSFTLCQEDGTCVSATKILHVDLDGWQSNDIPYCLEISTDAYTNATCDCNPGLHEYEPNIIQPGGSVSVSMFPNCESCIGLPEDCMTPYTSSPPHLLNVWMTFINQHNGNEVALPNAPLATKWPYEYYDPIDFTFQDWGCWDVRMSAKDNGDPIKEDSKYFDCVVYVEPDPLVVTDISLNELNSCQYYLESHAQNGAPNSGQQNTFGPCVGEEYYYEVYTWEIFGIYDSQTPLQEFLILDEETKNCVEINTNHPYFLNFQNSSTVTFIANVTITDLIGQTSSKSKIIEMPLPLIFTGDEVLSRCPGVSSTFNQGGPLAVSGSTPLFYLWNNTTGFLPPYNNTSNNPEFTAPVNGQTVVYGLQITDSEGCVINKNISVKGANVMADAGPPTIRACSSPQSIQFLGARPPDFSGQGGSGNYIYEWQASSPNLDYLSDIYSPNPTVYNPNTMGTSITYTLVVTDIIGGCSATDQINVVSAGTTNIYADAGSSQPWSSCYGVEIELGSPNNFTLNQFDLVINWTSSNPQFDINEIEITPPGPEGLATLIFNEDINTFLPQQPGTYTYTIQVADASNGCFEEDETTLFVIPDWLYTGFESELVPVDNAMLPQSAWNGQDLWSIEGVNRIITSSENALSGATPPFTWAMIEPIDVITPNYDPTIQYLENAQVDVSDYTEYGKMRVADAYGCLKDFITNRFLFYGPVDVTIVNTESQNFYCEDDVVCFDVYFDVSSESNYLPQTITTNYNYNYLHSLGVYNLVSSGQFTMQLISSDPAIYFGQACITIGDFQAGLEIEIHQIEIKANNSPFNLPTDLSSRSLDFVTSTYHNWADFKHLCNNNYETPFPLFDWWGRKEILIGDCSEDVILPSQSSGQDGLILVGAGPEGRVSIMPNFHAQKGSYFQAIINPCSNGIDLLPDEEIVQMRSDTLREISSLPDFNFIIHPNPTSGIVQFEVDSEIESDLEIEVFDLAGQRLKSLRKVVQIGPGKQSFYLDLSVCDDGAYIAALVSNHTFTTVKIIKSTGLGNTNK